MHADLRPTSPGVLKALSQQGPNGSHVWEQFYRLYKDWICAIAIRCDLRPHEVDDVLQETMTSMLRLLPTGRYDSAQGSFRAFLSAIVRQHVRQALFRRARHESRICSIDGQSSPCADPAPDVHADGKPLPDEVIEHRLRLALVQESLTALVEHGWATQKRVDIFLALTVHEQTPASVAGKFGTTRNNVDAAKHAIRQRLKLMIRCKEDCIDPGAVNPFYAPEFRLRDGASKRCSHWPVHVYRDPAEQPIMAPPLKAVTTIGRDPACDLAFPKDSEDNSPKKERFK